MESKNILIVDDDIENLSFLSQLLKEEGFRIFPANSGELALVSLEENIPDLILLDIKMPGIDGFTVCKQIKQNKKLAEIPIIFITSAIDINDKLEGLRLGAVDYVTKPFYKEELLARIKTHLSLYHFNKFFRDRTAEELHKWAHIFEHAEWGIVTSDPEGKTLEVMNPAFAKMHGYTVAELKGKPIVDIFAPDSRAEIPEQIQIANKKGHHTFESKHIRKDDSIFPVVMNVTAVKDNQGRILYRVINVQDITARKQIENTLKENEKKYRQLFESISDGFALHEIICDENGKPCDYRFLDINPAFEKLTGLYRSEIIGKTALQVLPKLEKCCIETYGKVALTGEAIRFENFSQDINKHFSIYAYSPGEGQFACMFNDITKVKQAEKEKRQLEKQIRQSQKMESIGTLAGGIAHDFNNMLSVITGNISYALNNVEKNNELYEILLDVQESSKQAQNLTHQLLTFSKGGAPIKKVSNINKLINESAIFSIRGSKANCRFELANDLWLSNVDEGQISQVIGNLIINANQAMPNGGTISIRTENTEIGVDSGAPLSAGRYIKIVVEDQGVGISKNHLPNIFEPYFTTKQKGSGLGLATAYSIIKRHGGHITVYSEIRKGTVFNIYLPASSKGIVELKDKEKYNHAGQGKILIMDDQESILKMVGRMLNKMGYEVASVTDGNQAIEIYREAYKGQNPFDLVILDLTVPGGMGGANTIPELLKIDPKVKAIVSSGYSNDPIMGNHEEYGFCGVLQKPYTKDQLAEVFNEIFSKND